MEIGIAGRISSESAHSVPIRAEEGASEPVPHSCYNTKLSDGVLAELAKEWLTFERLRQALLAIGAEDPLLIQSRDRDVAQIVCSLLALDRDDRQRDLARVALYRALADSPRFAKLCLAVDRPANEPPALAGEKTGELEVMLAAEANVFAEWRGFQLGMERNGAVICKVLVSGGKSGTGFLVNDRLVLTACHAVRSLLDEFERPLPRSHERLSFLFDDMIPGCGGTDTGRTRVRAARQWLKACSLPDPNEGSSRSPLSLLDPTRLDFALIELAEPIGRTPPSYRKGVPRNWIDLNDLADAPELNAQLLIAQHPYGGDLRLSVGLYRGHSNCAGRIRYWAPTDTGSSGAPCFNLDWKLYALHNAGYPQSEPRKGPTDKDQPINQGIPIRKIVDAIRKLDASLLEIKAPPAPMTAVTQDAEPILGRLDIAERIQEMLASKSTLTTMVIRGAKGDGKTWTGRLIRSLVMDRGHDAFFFDAERFAADTPERFSQRLVDEVVIDRHDKAPAPPAARQRARWITMQLADWTRHATAGNDEAVSARTLWIILDRLDEVRFTQETHDLLVALISDEAETPSSVRFVLLGYSGDLASVPKERVWRTELDLFSVNAILPFIEYVYDKWGFANDTGQAEAEAKKLIEFAKHFGVDTLPGLITALKRIANEIAKKRKKAIDGGDDE